MNFPQQLDVCFRARFPLLLLATREEERAVEQVKTACRLGNRQLLSWDSGDGFVWLSDETSTPPVARDALTALEQLDKWPGDASTVFLLRDFQDHWSNAIVRRKLRNLANRFRFTRKSIVVTSPWMRVPDELRDVTLMLELPLPTQQEFDGLLDLFLTSPAVRSDLMAAGREKLTRAALGLTISQAQRVLSAALVEDGLNVIDDRVIDRMLEEKRRILLESEALEFFPAALSDQEVGGLDNLKAWLRVREKAFTQNAREYGLPAPKGIVLIGIPGTGKSLTAKMISGMWHLPLIRMDVGALYGSLVGESEERTRRALRLAEAVSPCILWIDEVEKALAHGGLDSGTSTRVFASILTWMQEKTAEVFVVATANDVASLPAELLRRGRFDELFFLDLPSPAEREEIFAVHLRKRNRIPQDFDLPSLAAASEGFVGAEIEQSIIDAMYTGFDDQQREFTNRDILDALKRQVPLSISQREVVLALRAWLDEGRAQSASWVEI